VILRDVDSRQDLQFLLDQAEQRCRQRTAELDAAIKELDAFSYSVSHDLRAPLRHIDGFVEMLHQRLHSTLDGSCQEYLSIISTAAQQMGTLIDALLSFSRISRAPLFKSRVPLEKMAQSVVHDLRYETEDREVDWTIGRLPVVEGDPTLLRQVLYNLIANALKFTRTRDKAQVEVGVQDSDSEWVIHVQDNGVGFDMQYAAKLFGVFQRLHPVSDFEGTGIGLANVRRIIQRHGGRTWAEGTPDRGARFSFSLPRNHGNGSTA
jgi:light-regulated signal transduction histidine kinase (bacteriophytochrome)